MNSIRIALEAREKDLHLRAARSSESSRLKPEDKSPVRTEFQRDRDRILHSKAFRRLKHKTQVFFSPEGDHYRTRLTHTLEVSQIARTITRALNLNEDLSEAVALGHDLGHTPFGHLGETIIDRLSESGFRHNEQSLRVVDLLENEGQGLNLTEQVRDGIISHSKGRGPIMPLPGRGKLPQTLEGQIVRIADIIAYVNHDLDDAIRAGLITLADIPASSRSLLGDSFAGRIDTIVLDVIAATRASELEMISVSEPVCNEMMNLRNFLYKKVYLRSESELQRRQIENLLQTIYQHLLNNPPPGLAAYPAGDSRQRRIVDYIAGMTDRFALHLFNRIVMPEFLL